MRLRNAIFCSIFIVLGSPAIFAAERGYGDIKGWGMLLDPDGDCSFTVAADTIEIGVPATPHGLSAELNRMNAPRVVQHVSGDFDLQVEVDGTFQPQQPTVATRTAYLGAGLVLMRDDENYIRLERAALKRSGRVSHYVNFEQRRDGRLLRFGTPADYSLQADDEVQLKLVVRGDSVEGFARKNGGVWQTLGTKQFTETGGLSVGIAAINATNVPQQAGFRSLQLTRLSGDIAETDAEDPGSSPEAVATEPTIPASEPHQHVLAVPEWTVSEQSRSRIRCRRYLPRQRSRVVGTRCR